MSTPASGSPASKRKKRNPVAIGCLAVLAIVVVIVVIVAVTGSRTPTTPSAAVPIPAQQGAAGPDKPTVQHAEAQYLADLQAANVPLSTQSTLNGYAMCLMTTQGTSAADTQQQAQTAMGLTADQATAVYDTAQKDLCNPVQ